MNEASPIFIVKQYYRSLPNIKELQIVFLFLLLLLYYIILLFLSALSLSLSLLLSFLLLLLLVLLLLLLLFLLLLFRAVVFVGLAKCSFRLIQPQKPTVTSVAPDIDRFNLAGDCTSW
jgi:hypothetical protein